MASLFTILSTRPFEPLKGLALLVCIGGTIGAATAQDDGKGAEDMGPVGIAQREALRRQQVIKSAQDLFTAAEFDRQEGNYAEAIEKYRTAFHSLPAVPAARELREAVFDRYQRAAVEYARQLIEQAEWQKAEETLNTVMVEARDGGLPAGKVNPELRTLLGQLKSDDYFNKAKTPGHLENVRNVESLLKKANGFVEIGRYDSARNSYQQSLKIDPYNQAARRGLEQVERLAQDYDEVARSQTRASMMAKVDAGWETQPPPVISGAGGATEDFGAGLGTQQALIENKLRSIVIPQVGFEATPLQMVIEYLIQLSQELDTTEADPQKRGINIVIDTSHAANGANPGDKPLDLRLTNAPLGTVLKYATQQVGMKFRIDPYAVTIVPQSASDETGLITQSYLVPPGFISAGSGGGGGDAGPADPFSAAPANAGGATVIKRVTAREFLEARGVTFPEGASANFNPVNNTLLVHNNQTNIRLIESMIVNARKSAGKQVKVDFRFVSIGQDDLKQLGFEWLLGPFNMNQANSVFGSGGTYGSTSPAPVATDFPFVDPAGNILGQSPLTGGLRQVAPELAGLDALLSQFDTFDPLSSKAPGVFGLAGAFTDPQFQVVIRALNQRKGTDRISISSVTVNPGETARLANVREFIYPTEYDPPEIPNTVSDTSGLVPITPSHPTSFEVRDLGDLLEVTPTIGENDYAVTVDIKVDMSEFLGFVNYGVPINYYGLTVANEILMPIFDSIRHANSVTVYDGSTLVLGGLVGETIQHIQDKVPFLADSPLIGRLFRSDVKTTSKRAILLFASVRVLDPSGLPLHDLTSTSTPATVSSAAPEN